MKIKSSQDVAHKAFTALLNRLSRRAEIPRRTWSTDKWGRFLSGASIVIFLGFGYLFGDLTWTVWTALATLIGLLMVVTSVIGWCPFHELVKRLGVKDREEVFAEELRGCVRKAFEEGEIAGEVFVAEKRATEQEAFSSERLPAEEAESAVPLSALRRELEVSR